MGLLTEHQALIAARVLAEESARREHLVVSLSGAHAYGFPSPDSDLDLKAVHVAPTASLLGLSAPGAGPERLEVIEGVEIDYTSNELQPVLVGVLKGNGNYLERILGHTSLLSSPLLEELRPIARRSLSRACHRHYRGFAMGQLRELERSPAPTTKRVLYVLRTALTGAHLLDTGEIETDLSVTAPRYRFEGASALIEAKRAGEKSPLAPDLLERWTKEIGRAFEVLDAARDRSPLPEEPPNRSELEAWLVAARVARLGVPIIR